MSGDRGEMNCASCGKEIPPGSKFCPYCGSKC
ncbi:MAG: zinc-ribbon domain-containing protein [Deltaproteobacteria bacterium]|nr:zinc-ribbon domain-containing protein [Deltaproteobacteria bacterium]